MDVRVTKDWLPVAEAKRRRVSCVPREAGEPSTGSRCPSQHTRGSSGRHGDSGSQSLDSHRVRARCGRL